MKITLTSFPDFDMISKNTYTVLYADFNVIYYLYSNNISIDPNIELYYDSTAVWLTLKLLTRQPLKKQVSTDIQNSLVNYALQNELKLFFFGDNEDILTDLKDKLKEFYPRINIIGTACGYDYQNESIIENMNSKQIDVLFVGLGLGRQEKWILENYRNLETKFVISVGGWFQYLAGRKKRAPLFLRKIHLEWAHKFIFEFPRIWNRYMITLPKFLFLVLTRRIILEFSSRNK